VSDDPRAIPPGIRLHLEASQVRVRDLGIKRGAIDGMLSYGFAFKKTNRALCDIVLAIHHDEGWRVRRILKKHIGDGGENLSKHYASCSRCKIAAGQVADLIQTFLKDKTAPK
jgi:hypothetical protein